MLNEHFRLNPFHVTTKIFITVFEFKRILKHRMIHDGYIWLPLSTRTASVENIRLHYNLATVAIFQSIS